MLNKAFLFALKAHENQFRKDGTPYITHPVEVAMELARNGADEELICAGFLHDTLEDAGITREQLTAEFGENVAYVVATDSEDKSKTWEERKRIALEKLRQGSRSYKMLTCADKLSNIRSVHALLQTEGDAVWLHFKRGRADQEHLYRETAEALSSLEGLKMYEEYKNLIQSTFGEETEQKGC